MSGARTRNVLGSGIFGNVVEWYDFALYGYLAPVTAPLFFPASDPLDALIAAFAVFAVGALARRSAGSCMAVSAIAPAGARR